MNKYRPLKLKLDSPAAIAQGTVFVTKGRKRGKGKKGAKKYLPEDKWNALSAEEKSKLIESQKKGGLDNDDKSVSSAMSAKTIISTAKKMKALAKDSKNLK